MDFKRPERCRWQRTGREGRRSNFYETPDNLSDSEEEGMMGLVVPRAGIRRARCLLLLTGCVTVGVVALGPVAAHAATPSSLTGETFTTNAITESPLTGICPEDPTGTNGSFNFSVSGTASGPFPGIFTESGSFTTSPSGQLANFSSAFTVKNSAGTVTVTGTKSLRPHGAGTASCFSGPGGETEVDASVGTSYSAAILGVGQDIGVAAVRMEDTILGSGPHLVLFTEKFSSNTVGGPPPTSKAQCKHGGWKSFAGPFKNQGQCVSFVAEEQA
jgi:hypothetical protein